MFCSFGLSLLLGASAIAQVQVPYSTHDWTAGIVGPKVTDYFREAWADVKTPGNNRQYAVGTIEVRTTNSAFFSGQSALPVAPGFPDLGVGQRRQVVIVQCTEADPRSAAFQTIIWQRYFYGETTGVSGPIFTRASNGRGISVWPTDDPLTTRVAICGETYDQELPDNAPAEAFPAATATSPTGFIAVFDGNGTLLWTHHLFGVDPLQSCAVTDLSIRVEGDSREVVTYCGISTHGDPGLGNPLTLVLPAIPAPGPAGQWDGIVGRVSRTAAGAKAVEFHMNVLTPEQDGLFGIAEIEADYTAVPPRDRFVVVGSSTLGTDTFATSSVFDAAPTRALPMHLDLVSEDVALFGSGERQTIARDVLVLHDSYFDAGTGIPQDMFAVVGSTNDPALFAGGTWAAPAAMRGLTDGFVMMFSDAAPGTTMRGGSYFGGDGDDGLTGVQGWNEYPDHFVVTGFTQGFEGVGSYDIGVESYYLVSDTVGVSPPSIRRLRQDAIGGIGTDRPTVMGVTNATTTGLSFGPLVLGDPAGGGIAVDQRARVNVVGQTDSPDYPSGLLFGGGRARDAGAPPDAVRTVCDMLPVGNSYAIGGSTVIVGTGRTDGSGSQTMVDLTMTPPQAPWMLPVGFSGGTTPLCALKAFGRKIGEEPPGFVPVGATLPNSIFRMLIEYEGPPPAAGVVGAIIVSRPTAPPTGGSAVLSAFQFDFPGAPGTLAPGMLAGVEVYTPGLSPLYLIGLASPNHAMRQLLFAMPTTTVLGQPMTVQVFCWIPSLVPGGLGVVGACPGVSEFTATPAMWLPL